MIVFLGDIHGDFDKLIKYIKIYGLENCTIFQVGDFGIGFELYKKELSRLKFLNNFLKAHDIILYAIRGNHDDPAYFKGTDSNLIFSNIVLVPDYTILNLEGKNILCIGGAISIDRKPKINYKGRKEGSTYWSDEEFVFDEEKIRTFRNIDIVVTHTAPSFVEPIFKIGAEDWFNSDITLEEELDLERNNMSNMFFILKQNNKIQNHFYGHFHFSHNDVFDGIAHKLLDIFEFSELRT